MNSRKLSALLITVVLHGLVLAGLVTLSDAPRQRTPPEPLRVALLAAASPQETVGSAAGEPVAVETTAVARPDDAPEQSAAPVPPPAAPPAAPPVAEPPVAEPPPPAPPPAAEPPAAVKPPPAPTPPAPVRKPEAKVAPPTPSPRAPPRPERVAPRERPTPRESLPATAPSPSAATPPDTAVKPFDEPAASATPSRSSADPTSAASAVAPGPSASSGPSAPSAPSGQSSPMQAPAQAAAVRTGPRVDASWSGNKPPPYPMLARRMGEEGEVLLDVHVGRDGRVTEVRLRQSSGSDLLDGTAIDTVRQWRFQPATVDGQPVAEWYRNWKWVFRLKN